MKKYLPGLDALRFFAALGIIIHHVEQLKMTAGVPFIKIWEDNLVREMGKKGIMFFLVLSGFLVTRNLLLEIKSKNTISFSRFYRGRRLRVWPLYFLIIIWSFFIFPLILPLGEANRFLYKDLFVKLAMFFSILPNLALILFSPVWGLSQAWVIGVEEQFYLFWPWLIKKFHKRFFILCAVILLIKYIIEQIVRSLPIGKPIVFFLSSFLYGDFGFYIEYMIIGALGAYLLVFNKQFILKIIYSRFTQIITYLIFVFYITPYKIFLFFLPLYHYINGAVTSYALPAILTILILNVGTNHDSILKPYNSFINSLGKISYGIYMYHVTVIFFVLKLLAIFNVKRNLFIFNIALYSLTIIITVLISHLSYKYFEFFFIKKKKKNL